MSITTDNRPRSLYAFNQLLDRERPQVANPPADEKRPLFFLNGAAVYDLREFRTRYDGLWHTNGDRRLAVQRHPENQKLVYVGVIHE